MKKKISVLFSCIKFSSKHELAFISIQNERLSENCPPENLPLKNCTPSKPTCLLPMNLWKWPPMKKYPPMKALPSELPPLKIPYPLKIAPKRTIPQKVSPKKIVSFDSSPPLPFSCVEIKGHLYLLENLMQENKTDIFFFILVLHLRNCLRSPQILKKNVWETN